MNPLELLLTVDPTIKGSSICSQVWDKTGYTSQQTRIFDNWMAETVKKWEHFSGDLNYPVPASLNDKSFTPARSAYNKAHHDETMWDKTTEYSSLRHDLFNFLKEEASREWVVSPEVIKNGQS